MSIKKGQVLRNPQQNHVCNMGSTNEAPKSCKACDLTTTIHMPTEQLETLCEHPKAIPSRPGAPSQGPCVEKSEQCPSGDRRQPVLGIGAPEGGVFTTNGNDNPWGIV